MSSSSAPKIGAFKADAAVSAYLIVKGGSGTDGIHVAKATAATQKLVGIQQSASTAAEDQVEVALPGGGGKVTLGGSVVFGDFLTADASGKAVATTSAADRVIAVAMQDGAADDVIGVEVVSFLI